ncbi:hypothetical protein J6590_042617 [Homalodisca vitripennis]|nr:hypothetical protein J6590_042617 [Homalodisca vitripennis]
MRSVTARPATAHNYGIDKEHTSWRVDLHRSPLQPRTALTRQHRESAKRELGEAFQDDEDPDQPSYGAGIHKLNQVFILLN